MLANLPRRTNRVFHAQPCPVRLQATNRPALLAMVVGVLMLTPSTARSGCVKVEIFNQDGTSRGFVCQPPLVKCCTSDGEDGECKTQTVGNQQFDCVCKEASNEDKGQVIDTGPDGICDSLAIADDIQKIPFGNGFPDALCIEVGPNFVLDSVADGDDVDMEFFLTTGPNGVCESVASGDDIQTVEPGNGWPFTRGITPGPDVVLETIPSGDDEENDDLVCVAPIPTVSEWGLIVLTVLLLTAAMVVVGRRRRPAAA